MVAAREARFIAFRPYLELRPFLPDMSTRHFSVTLV